MINPFPDLVLQISSLEPSLISQSVISTPLIDSNISLLVSGGLSPTPNSAFNNIALELFDLDLHVLAHSPTKVLFRRSIKVSKPPFYLKDFHYNLLSHKDLPSCATSYSLSKYLSYGSLSTSHKNFVLNFSSQFYQQAIKFPHWRAAMKVELDAMELNKTWSVVFSPKEKHFIGCEWIYKVKYKSDGFIEKHKARLVAKGYTQQEGLDFIETFSHVTKLVTVKVLLALAISQKWHLV